ncbi:MAG: 3-phosphoshikimate 1-carboxyvinyltransferase [Actinomycetota bacterium]|nr:3-phosphoshikimate 1-carboxyvinyltransferase [Actinomycetota bacterium]
MTSPTRTTPSESLPWPAPCALGPVDADIALPGSKSATNRALVLAALAEGTSVVRRPLRSRDTLLMTAGLRALGVAVTDDGSDWRVVGSGRPLRPAAAAVDVGNAGTVARFLPPVAALAAGEVRFDGDARMRERPIGALLAALRAIGVEIDDGGRGALPAAVRGTGRVTGGPVLIDASSSSQLVSGLLLAAPRFERGLYLRHEGGRLPSAPHLAMTVAMLRAAGAEVDDDVPAQWAVSPGPLRACVWDVEPDLSSAAPFLAAAMLTGGRVRVAGWPLATTQPGGRLPGLLERMGGTYRLDAAGLTLDGPGRVHGLDADLGEVGELTPVLAALAALADSPSRLSGVAHLRLQETDRLAALAREINALGGSVTETADGLSIAPRPLRGGVFATYDDHRLAMAAAVLGLAVQGVSVENVATTAKTLPGFVELWDRMLGAPV